MKINNNIWLLLHFMLISLFFVCNISSAENYDSADREAASPAVLSEPSVLTGASVQSYYVVNDNFYVLVQKPMAKAYGAFAMVPVIMPDSDGQSDMDTDAGLSSTGARQTAADSGLDPDKARENHQTADVAINLNFRGLSEKPEQTGSGLDNPQDNNEDIADPLQQINRVFFAFNDKLYFWALKPAARAYGFIVPEWGRTRVKNVFDNIQAPVRLFNAFLQFNLHKVGSEFARFALNSTVGIGGLFDIASRHPELRTSEEDMGQTFGSYGLGEGFYLVLPFFGPSSLRDAAGRVGDGFLDPVWRISPLRAAVAVSAFDRVSDTSFQIGDYEDIKESAMDPYISIRDMYKQYRRNKVLE